MFYGERIIGLVQSGDIVGGVPKYPYPGAASDQIAGQWKFDDINKDGKIDVTNDRTVLGKATPILLSVGTMISATKISE